MNSDSIIRPCYLAVLALAIVATARTAEPRVALKDAFKEHFPIGTAVNRGMVTGGAGFRRSTERSAKDIALMKAQFKQITAENDMKWQLVHPREGMDGHDFGPADAFVNFGLSNKMTVVGRTLVWHGQTPNWVFAGTNPAPFVTDAAPLAANTNASGTNRFGSGRPGGFGPYNGLRASRDELLQRMREHIHKFECSKPCRSPGGCSSIEINVNCPFFGDVPGFIPLPGSNQTSTAGTRETCLPPDPPDENDSMQSLVQRTLRQSLRRSGRYPFRIACA